jgi:hypothetical protein
MNKDLVGSLAWAGGMIALALGASAMRELGYLDPQTVTRLVIGANGLMVAWFGNRLPKAFVPDVRARQVARVGGWLMVLSGLAYTALWAFAPIDVAVPLGCAAIAGGIAVTVGYFRSLRARGRTA